MASVGTETQIEYSIAGAATILRLYCRWKYLGFKGWGIDDYFAISAFVWYTFMLVGIELVCTDTLSSVVRRTQANA